MSSPRLASASPAATSLLPTRQLRSQNLYAWPLFHSFSIPPCILTWHRNKWAQFPSDCCSVDHISFQTRWAHCAGKLHRNKWAKFPSGCCTVDHIRYVEHIACSFKKKNVLALPKEWAPTAESQTVQHARCANFAKTCAASRQDGHTVLNNCIETHGRSLPQCVAHIRYIEHIARAFGKASQTPPKQMGTHS